MTTGQAVERLGEPDECTQGSAVFLTCEYRIDDGGTVYLGYLRQADYLDRAYANQGNGEGDYVFISLVPASLELPAGVQRQLTLEDFEGLSAGMEFFPDIYNQVGPPNNGGIFEGGYVSLVYSLSSGGRIAMQTHGGYGCISEISYSPDSFGPSWTILSEDTEEKCTGE
jgi:hypothetical protein